MVEWLSGLCPREGWAGSLCVWIEKIKIVTLCLLARVSVEGLWITPVPLPAPVKGMSLSVVLEMSLQVISHLFMEETEDVPVVCMRRG